MRYRAAKRLTKQGVQGAQVKKFFCAFKSWKLGKMNQNRDLLRHYLWKYRQWIGIGLVSLVVVDVIDVLPPLLLKEVVDIAVERRPVLFLARVACAYFGISLIQGLCRYGWRMFLIRSSIFAGRDLRARYAKHLFGLSASFFDRSRMGDLMSLATNDVEAVRTAIGTGLLVFADALIYLLTVPIAMYWLSPQLTLFVCLPLPFIPWIVMRKERAVHDRFEKVQECFGKISAMTHENLNGIRVIKAFAREDNQIERMRELGEEYVRLNLSLARIQSAMGPTLDFLMSIGMVILLFWGGKTMIFRGEAALSLGVFVAFQRYIQRMVWPMVALGMAVNYYQRSISSSKRLNQIFSMTTDVPESERPVIPEKKAGKIEFRKLSFQFQDSPHLVLSQIELQIEAGERVAFVGAVGAGKTALLSLLPRLYPVQKGMLLIDGIDINEWPLAELRRQVGYVSQDVFLFNDSVIENIAFGLNEWVQEPNLGRSVENASRMASIHEEVLGFSKAYQTNLGERGVSLSGGQKQRLTLARALAKEPSILILDDALSSVDVQTEERVLQNLLSRPGRNTELVAAHRISTVKAADRIVVLNAGRVTQMGSHAELIAQKKSEYWRFFEQQQLKEDLEGYH